jgi:hypothetical protein
VTADAVDRMDPGSVIVDLAAERGGNCESSEADQRVVRQGVVILGPTNLPSEVPYHASQMFSTNVTRFLLHITTDGVIQLDRDDEIISETLVAYDGDVPQARIRELLDLAPPGETSGGQDESATPRDLPSPATEEGERDQVETSPEDLSTQVVESNENGAELKLAEESREEEAEDGLQPDGEGDEENSGVSWNDSSEESTPDEEPDDPPENEDEV